jgi:hypothetical protein
LELCSYFSSFPVMMDINELNAIFCKNQVWNG